MAKTTEKTAGSNGFFDVTKAFGEFHLPGFNVEAFAACQRKNLEALTQANQLVLEGLRALAQRQAEIVQQSLHDVSAVFQTWTQPGAPQDRLASNAAVAKQSFEKGIANARELGELAVKANGEAFSVISKRVSESLDEMRELAHKQVA